MSAVEGLRGAAAPTGQFGALAPILERYAALLVFTAALSVYLRLPTTHHSYDAVAGGVLFYQWLASGSLEQLFHKYHILYLPLAALVDASLARVGFTTDPLTLLQIINSVFAAGTAAVYYRLSRLLGLPVSVALTTTTFLAGGFAFWFYATDAESYAPSLFFVVLAFRLALGPIGAGRAALAGFSLGLAVAFHVTCILALPGLAIMTWDRSRSGWRRSGLVALVALVVALTPYAATFAAFDGVDPIRGFAGELRASVDPGYSSTVWWSVAPGNLWRQWRGLARAMVPADWPATPTSFPLVSLVMRSMLSVSPIVLLFLLLRPAVPGRRHVVVGLTVWFAATFLFFSAYNVAAPKFASYQWAPLLLLLGLALHRASRLGSEAGLATRLVSAMVAILTITCSLDLVLMQTDPGGNPHLQKALRIASHTDSGDLVVHLGRGQNQYQKVYTPYFAVRPSVVLDTYFDTSQRSGAESLRVVSNRLARHEGRIVVLDDVIEDGESCDEFERVHGLPPGTLAGFFGGLNPRVFAEDPVVGRLWTLDRRALYAELDGAPMPVVRPGGP